MPGMRGQMRGQIPATCAVAAVLLTLLCSAAARSDIKLRNSTLEVVSAAATPLPETAAVYNSSTVALGQAPNLPPSLIAQFTNATNPLDSYANIEANYTYVLIPGGNLAYQGLELALRNNNTLLINNASIVGLSRSTLGLGRASWLLIANSSALSLNDSRLVLNSSSGWVSDSATTSLTNSVAGLQDVTALWANSVVNLENSTVSIGAASYQTPLVAPGAYPTALFVGGSAVSIAGTSWTGRNIPVVFDASNVTLSNSTLTLYNSKLVLNAATVTLNNAEIILYNSTLSLLGNATFNYPVSNVTVFKAYPRSLPSLVLPLTNGTDVSVPAGPEQALVGVPLGLVSNVTVTSADADLIFTGV